MKGVSIEISDLCVSYGHTRVLQGINLSIKSGEFIALLGASGCGKTTLLRSLAGFVAVESGCVAVEQRDVTHVPPEKRDMSMMFQSYALWPHMTVAQNIGFALRIRKMPSSKINVQVEKMLHLVGLGGYAERNVTQLSGGQRQRVALARALAVDPPVLLLDEPLSNLDARIRLSMRHEVKALQKKLGITTVLVTHDREEAMAMADRVVILNQGRIEQVGTPEEIYHRPASAFVAMFMGAENVYPMIVRQKAQSLFVDADPLCLGAELPIAQPSGEVGVNLRVKADGAASAYFRGEAAYLSSSTWPREWTNGTQGLSHTVPHLQLSGQVVQSSYLGDTYSHTVRVGEHEFLINHPERIDINEMVDVCVPAAALHIFDHSDKAAANSVGAYMPNPTKQTERVA